MFHVAVRKGVEVEWVPYVSSFGCRGTYITCCLGSGILLEVVACLRASALKGERRDIFYIYGYLSLLCSHEQLGAVSACGKRE